jgi:hypothetical protein
MEDTYEATRCRFPTYANKLVATLSQPNLPPKLPAIFITRALGVEWRTLSKRLLARPRMQLILGLLGWSYHPTRGCKRRAFREGRS